ncbi:unnamed protein product [Cladocopium goreaui]|uniref:Uncharacterized protein n=1 Tax=Cladocopium goreaui TaxID=2562237 RepID=A0A9P1G486_9DINO|nr:unnamed protein product [Cladocopium goreaui]
MYAAFKMLGLKPRHSGYDLTAREPLCGYLFGNASGNRSLDDALATLSGFDAAMDEPYMLLYEEIMAAFPEAKFLLTISADYASRKETCLQNYERHIERVQQVIPPQKLLVYNWSDGLSATVVVGATAADISITSQMNSFTTETRDCAEIDSTYEGSYSLACEAQSLSSNTTGCSPVPVAGTTVEARQVVESAVAFNLPAVEATVDEMQAVMELPATKRAYELTLSESLGVPPEENPRSPSSLVLPGSEALLQDVTVFSIQVYDSTDGGPEDEIE